METNLISSSNKRSSEGLCGEVLRLNWEFTDVASFKCKITFEILHWQQCATNILKQYCWVVSLSNCTSFLGFESVRNFIKTNKQKNCYSKAIQQLKAVKRFLMNYRLPSNEKCCISCIWHLQLPKQLQGFLPIIPSTNTTHVPIHAHKLSLQCKALILF